MIKIRDITTALNLFEESATKHAEATERGDYKTCNKYYTTIAQVVSFLKEKNDLIALKKFINHSSIGVRMWAGTYLLQISEKEGIEILLKISQENGIHAFTAKTTISEWQKGNLIL